MTRERMQEYEEDLDLYEALLRAAFDIYGDITTDPRPQNCASAERIWDAAHAFVQAGDPSVTDPAAQAHPAVGAAFDALRKLGGDWPELRAGTLTGEDAYRHHSELWQRLMCEPPMGTYAQQAAHLINAWAQPGQTIIELGAGVGNTSRLLKLPDEAAYIRTDRNPFLLPRDLPGTIRRYDFDQSPDLPEADIVFAVNALHCATSPARTIRQIHSVLKKGGILLLAEGAPFPAPDRPWALDALFCQFQGWWDRSGFRARTVWEEDLRSAGFSEIRHQKLTAYKYDLGGLIWAQR